MTENLIERPVNRYAFGHQNHRASTRREHGLDIGESKKIIRHVFQDIKTYHGVKRPLKRRNVIWALQIAAVDFAVAPVLQSVSKTAQMLCIYVSGEIAPGAFGELDAQVAD